MSVRLQPELPDRLFALVNGERLEEKLDKVVLLITMDEKGWPYAAILSYLEVLAPDRYNLRLAPWSNSTTTANLRRNSRVTLLIVEENMAYYLQGAAAELTHEMEGFPGMAKINVRIESILEDKAMAYEGSARITTGIRFENPQMDDAHVERGRRVLAALRQ